MNEINWWDVLWPSYSTLEKALIMIFFGFYETIEIFMSIIFWKYVQFDVISLDSHKILQLNPTPEKKPLTIFLVYIGKWRYDRWWKNELLRR